MKKIFNLLSKIAVLILTLFLTSCYYDEVIEDIVPTNDDVSFAADIQPIFNNNCVACHNGTLDPDLREGNSYNFITVTDPALVIPFDADGSELYQRLIGVPRIMPPGGALSNAKVFLVKDWINQGALNN